MSKKVRKIDKYQLSIFDFMKTFEDAGKRGTQEGEFRIINELRESLRQAIKQSPYSRHQIAGEMSHLLGETITKEMIDSWTRRSDEVNGRPGRHVPAEYLPAFCKVTGSKRPLVLLGKKIGLFVLPGPEALRSEIHKIDEEIKELRAEKRKRMYFLKEMERKK